MSWVIENHAQDASIGLFDRRHAHSDQRERRDIGEKGMNLKEGRFK